MSNIKLIDNKRVYMLDVLKQNINKHKHFSIATGYWDLKGTSEIIDNLNQYDSIRLLIGQEPYMTRDLPYRKLNDVKLDNDFPSNDFKKDLEEDAKASESENLRQTASKLIKLIHDKKITVKLYQKQRLHAKTYIFGNESDPNAFGIVGSSNFTYAGLKGNSELNSLENQVQMVVYQPKDETMPHTHLSWFNEMWEEPSNVDWNLEFIELLKSSPLGDTTFSSYESYMKTLMELYPEELEVKEELGQETQDILFSFQNRNAGLLINKLERMNVAILADSVGLGKTITAGAVIKHYLETNRTNIQVIAPASLKQQWQDDLAKILNVDIQDGAYRIVSQQDIKAIEKIYDEYEKSWRKSKKIDLFVIDEAHNLRSGTGNRVEAVLKLLQQHPESHILLLTATPINNSLIDIANQIQLASKGKLYSFNVPYQRPSDHSIEMIDFFDALKRIQSNMKRQEKAGKKVDYDIHKKTIHAGLRRYLVRSTRQGVEAEGVIKKGKKIVFPKSTVESIKYEYSDLLNQVVQQSISFHIDSTFESLNPLKLNIELITEFTQQTSHPLDFIPLIKQDPQNIKEIFDLDDKFTNETIINSQEMNGMINNLLQVIYTLGFPSYRPNIYRHIYYGKTVNDIRALKKSQELGIQLTIHNILHITWLKRLESSSYALLKSVMNYKDRLTLFKKFLDKGYIVSLQDALLLDKEYGEGDDIERAFTDYDEYLKHLEAIVGTESEDTLMKKGVERVIASDKEFNIQKLYQDIERDEQIIDVIIDLLNVANLEEHNNKLQTFSNYIKQSLNNNKHGNKVLVFSFFADTIEFLKNELPTLLKNELPNFSNEAEFLSGKSNDVENIVGRFSPISKNYAFKHSDSELNYLFATDILSEGQNLQDAGILINYDLHWNPVRMIQRNGRINRLGSKFEEVLIANMRPSDDIDLYLKLVNRLESKINVIKNTVGLDQGILNSADVNPIQFIEQYYEEGTLPPEDDLLAYTDEHILNLRKFLAEYKDQQSYIDKVKNIPLGKWNYLPENTKTSKVLSLFHVNSRAKNSEKTFNDLFFIEVEPEGDFKAIFKEQYEALNMLKTTPEDNIALNDNIKIDRNQVMNRARRLARRIAANTQQVYNIQNQYQKALISLKPHFPLHYDFLKILQNGIKDVISQKEMERILREVNKQIADKNQISVKTITEFTKMINNMLEDSEVIEKEIVEEKGVLFYASRD
jgi:ERCC4-related helicase